MYLLHYITYGISELIFLFKVKISKLLTGKNGNKVCTSMSCMYQCICIWQSATFHTLHLLFGID